MSMPSPIAAPRTMQSNASITISERLAGRTQESITHLTGHSIKLGRTPGGGDRGPNQIVLVAPFIGRDQAQIEPDGIGHRIIDLGCPNKFFVNDQPILTEYTLRDGDVLVILEPRSGDEVRLTYKNVLLAEQSSTPIIPHYPLDAAHQHVTIGRDQCDILLEHPTISRLHARINRLPNGGHLLHDAGSSNGTFVGDQRVARGGYPLKKDDVIYIGPYKLIYLEDHLAQYNQQGTLRIDVRNMNQVAPNNGKTILDNVSLSIAPCEFVALVGPSGAGKSSLMKAISGFTRADSVGQQPPVLVNGEDYYHNFDRYRSTLGYVPQDDILHSSLSIHEALRYTARLRLPPDTESSKIKERIDDSLQRVRLDFKESDKSPPMIGSLSGGQRKRVSIASELLAEPSLFFLDEPTSGLDPGLERQMMILLHELSRSGKTVVLVTHATENITECDLVAFMAEGRLVYFGPPKEAIGFFGVDDNKFSQIYDQLDASVTSYDQLIGTKLKHEYDSWRPNPSGKPSQFSWVKYLKSWIPPFKATPPEKKEQPSLSALWMAKYQASRQYQTYVVGRLGQAMQPLVSTSVEQPKTPPVSNWRQYVILTQRYFNLIRRDQRNLMILLLQSPIIALMLLLLTKAGAFTGITNVEQTVARSEAQSLLFMLVAVGVWFGIINSAREITKENVIYRRERLSNLKIVPYIASKITVLFLLILIQNLILLVIVSAKVRFPVIEPALFGPAWLEVFVTLMLVSLGGMVLGLLISAFATTSDQAISIVPLALIPQLLFAGLIFTVQPDTPVEKLSWLMVSRWGMDALGTSTNLNALCQLPNVTYENVIQTQCQVTERVNQQGGVAKSLFETFPFMNKGLSDSTLFPAAFEHTTRHLASIWGILLLFTVVGIILIAWKLKRRDSAR